MTICFEHQITEPWALPDSYLPTVGRLFLLLLIIICILMRPWDSAGWLLPASMSLWKDSLLLLHQAQTVPSPYLCAMKHTADDVLAQKISVD